ncbi:MAG: hypothetical protein H6538_01155 [Bacteroidales bacterium]|nr:hypothetical protein [Bacteroidales bacterium]MCB8999841.1 hypothetical protein [Bacteroidales bacterium]MCB9012650.1 hypothetical protein [Bacteroidales bacterium]
MLRNILIYIFLISGTWFIHGNSMAQEQSADVEKCAMAAGSDVTYLKDFVVKLDAAPPNQKPPIYRTSLALRKGVIYRFSICNGDYSEGEAVLRLYDQANMLLSTYYPETGKEYKSISFACQKSAAYTIVISFKDGKKGEAVGILSYVNK